MQDSRSPLDYIRDIKNQVESNLPKPLKIKKSVNPDGSIKLTDENTGDIYDINSLEKIGSGVKEPRLKAIDKKIIETQDRLPEDYDEFGIPRTNPPTLIQAELDKLYKERSTLIDNLFPESNALYLKLINEENKYHKEPIGSRPDGTPLFISDVVNDYSTKISDYENKIKNNASDLVKKHPILKNYVDDSYNIDFKKLQNDVKKGAIKKNIVEDIVLAVNEYNKNIDESNATLKSFDDFIEQSPLINSKSRDDFEKLRYYPVSDNTADQFRKHKLDIDLFNSEIKTNPDYLSEYLKNGNLLESEDFLEQKKERPSHLEMAVYQGYYPEQFRFTNPSDYTEYKKLQGINAIQRVINDKRKVVADDFLSGVLNMGKQIIKGAYNGTLDLGVGFANIFLDKKDRDSWHTDRALNKEYTSIINSGLDNETISRAFDVWQYNNTPLFGGYISELADKTGKVTGEMIPFIATLSMMGANSGMFKLMESTEGMTVGKILSSGSLWKQAAPTYLRSALGGVWNTFPKYAVKEIDDLKKKPNATWLDYAARLTLSLFQSGMNGMSEVTGAHFLGRGIGNVLNKFSKEAVLFNGGLVRRARDYFLADNVGEVLEERVNDLLSDEFFSLLQGKPWINEKGEMRSGFKQFFTDKVIQSAEEYLMFMFSSGGQTLATVKNLKDDIRFQTFADHLWNRIKTDPELGKYNLGNEQLKNIESLFKSILPILGTDKKLSSKETENRAVELLKKAAIDEGFIDMHSDKGVNTGALLRALDRNEQMNHLNENWNDISKAITALGKTETKEDLEKMIMGSSIISSSLSQMTYDRYINSLNTDIKQNQSDELRLLAEDNKDLIVQTILDNNDTYNQSDAEKIYSDAMDKKQYSMLLQNIDDIGKKEFIENFQDFSWDDIIKDLKSPDNIKIYNQLPSILRKYGFEGQRLEDFLPTLNEAQSWELYKTLYNPAGIRYDAMMRTKDGRQKSIYGIPTTTVQKSNVSYSKEDIDNIDYSRMITLKGGDYSRLGDDYYLHPNGKVYSMSVSTRGLEVLNPKIIDDVKQEYEYKNKSSIESKGYELVNRKDLDNKLSAIKDGKILIAKNITTEEFTDYLKESKIAKNIGVDRIMNAVNQTSIENFLFFYNTAKLKNPDITQESAINQAIVSIDKQMLGAMMVDYNKGDVANTDNLKYIPTHNIEESIYSEFRSITRQIPTSDINFISPSLQLLNNISRSTEDISSKIVYSDSNTLVTNTDAIELLNMLKDNSIDIVLTDPPFGINYKYNKFNDTKDNVQKLITDFIPEARRVGKLVVVTPGFNKEIISQYPSPDYEFDLYGDNKQSLYIYGKLGNEQINNLKLVLGTPLEDVRLPNNLNIPSKPIRLWINILHALGSEGDLVLDPFAGSGTTTLAARKLGIYSISNDIDNESTNFIKDEIYRYKPLGELVNYDKIINKNISASAKRILDISKDIEGIVLVGSTALSKLGTVYRFKGKEIHDLDFRFATHILAKYNINNIDELLSFLDKVYTIDKDSKGNPIVKYFQGSPVLGEERVTVTARISGINVDFFVTEFEKDDAKSVFDAKINFYKHSKKKDLRFKDLVDLLNFRYYDNSKFRLYGREESKMGYYDFNTKNIGIYIDNIKKSANPNYMFIKTVTHEVVHRALDYILSGRISKKFEKSGLDLFNDFKKFMESGKYSDIQDIYDRIMNSSKDELMQMHEFFAEALSNHKFQGALITMTDSKYKSKLGHLLSEIADWIAKLFNSVLKTQVDGNLLFETINLVHTSLEETNIETNRNMEAITKLIEEAGKRNSEFVTSNVEDNGLNTLDINNAVGNSDKTLINAEENDVDDEKTEESTISNVIIKQIVDDSGNPLFRTVQDAADYVNTHTFEEFKDYIKNAKYDKEKYHNEYPYESYASNVYRLFNSRKRYKVATISFGEKSTIINTSVTNYKDVEGLDKSVMMRRQHFDNMIDALKQKGISLEIVPVVRVDKDKKVESKLKNIKGGEINKINEAGYFFIPTNNTQFLIPKDSIQGIELTGNNQEDNYRVFQTILDIATQEKDPYTNVPISEEKQIKRFGNMLGSASKFWMSPEISDWVNLRKDRIRVEGSSVYINTVVLNLDNEMLPPEIKKYFDTMKDGIFADGAVFSSADVHQLVHMANGVPVDKFGGAIKWKRSEPSLLVKAADFKVEPGSALDRFMKNVKWTDANGVQHTGVERIIVKSALKIGEKGLYKDVTQLTWNDVTAGQFGKEIDGMAVINYDMSKDSFINAKGKVKRTADGATPSWIANSVSAYIPEIIDVLVKEMNNQTDKFMDNIKGITNDMKIRDMNEFLKNNANLTEMTGYKALEILMKHDSINTLDPMFFEPYIRNVFSPAFIKAMKHVNKGNTPVIRPDMGGLGNLKGRVKSALLKSMPSETAQSLIDEGFDENGFLKPGYAVIDESQNKVFRISNKDIMENNSDVIITVNPPGFFTDARVIRIIGVIPNDKITINNVEIETDKNTIYVSYQDFIYRSGKDFDIDNVIVFRSKSISDILRNINNELGDRALEKFLEYKVEDSKFSGGKEGFVRIYGNNAPKFLYKLLEMFGEKQGKINVRDIERLTKLLNNDESELGLEIGRLFSIKVFHDAVIQTGKKANISIYPNIVTPNEKVLKKVELVIKDVDVNLALMKHLTDLTIDWKSDQRILSIDVNPTKLLFQIFNIDLSNYLIANPDEKSKLINQQFINTVGDKIYISLSNQIGSFRALLRNPKSTMSTANLKGMNKVRGIIKTINNNSRNNDFKSTLVARVANHFINKMSEMPKMVLTQSEMDRLNNYIWGKMGVEGKSYIELDFISLFSRIGNAPKLGIPTDVEAKNIINGTLHGKSENGLAHISYTLLKWRQLRFGDNGESMIMKNYNPFIDLFREIFSNGNYRLENVSTVQFKNKIKDSRNKIIDTPFNQCYHVLKNEGGLVKFAYQRWYEYNGRKNVQTLFETNNFDEYIRKLQEPGLFSMSMIQINEAFSDSDVTNWFSLIQMRSDANRRATFKVLSKFIPKLIVYKTNNMGRQSDATHGFSNEKYEEIVHKSLLGLYKGDGFVQYGMRYFETLSSTYTYNEEGKIINYPYENYSPGILMISEVDRDIGNQLLNKYFLNRSAGIDNLTNIHPQGIAMSLDSLTDSVGMLLPAYKKIEMVGTNNIIVNNMDELGSIPIKNGLARFNGYAVDLSFNINRPINIEVKLSGSKITHFGLSRVTSHHLQVEREMQDLLITFRKLVQAEVNDLGAITNYFENNSYLYEDVYKIADGTDENQILKDYNPFSTKQTGLVYGVDMFNNSDYNIKKIEGVVNKLIENVDVTGNMKKLLANQVAGALYLRYMYDYLIPNMLSNHLKLLNLYKRNYDKLDSPEALGLLMTEIDKYNGMLNSTTQMATYLKQHVSKKDSKEHYIPSFYLPKVHNNYEDMLIDLQKSGMSADEANAVVNEVKRESTITGEVRPSAHHYYHRTEFGYTDLINRDFTVHENYLHELAKNLRYSQLSVQYLHDRMKWMINENASAQVNMDRIYATITNQFNMANYSKWNEVSVGDGVTFVEKTSLEDNMKREIGKLRMDIYRKLAERGEYNIDIEPDEEISQDKERKDIKFSKGKNVVGLQNLEYRRFLAYYWKKITGIEITPITTDINNREFHDFIFKNRKFIDDEYVNFGTKLDAPTTSKFEKRDIEVGEKEMSIYNEMKHIIEMFYKKDAVEYKNWSKDLKNAFSDWQKQPIDRRLLREYLKIQALMEVNKQTKRYRKVFGEVSSIDANTITIKRNVNENGKWISKEFSYNKMNISGLQKHNNYKLSQSLAKTLNGIGVKADDRMIDSIASSVLKLGSKAMLGFKFMYSMVNYAGATAMQYIYFGHTPKSIIKGFTVKIKDITEGNDGEITDTEKRYIKYVIDNAEYFLGGVDKVLGLLTETVLSTQETDMKMSAISRRMGGKTNLLKLINEGIGENKKLMELLDEYGRKPNEATFKDIVLSGDRLSIIWNKLRLSNPLMWIPGIKDTFLANAYITEFMQRRNAALKGTNIALNIEKMNPDVDKKVLDEFMHMITFAMIDAGNKYTNFLYIPGLYLSELGSTPLGRNLDQFAHYTTSACAVMYDVILNLVRQHKDFANIPNVRVKSFINYEVEYKGQTIKMTNLSAFRQFWRMVNILFATALLKKGAGITSGVFVNGLTEMIGKTILDVSTRAGASSIQIPVFDSLITLAGLVIKSLVPDDDDKNPKESKEWKQNRAFWNRFLPRTYEETLMETYTNINKEDISTIIGVDGEHWKGNELARSVLVEYQKDLFRSLNPLPLGVGNRFIVDMAYYLFMTGASPMKSEDIGYVLLNQLETIIPGMYMGRQVSDFLFSTGMIDTPLYYRSKKDKLLTKYEIAKRNINKLEKMDKEGEITATQKDKWKPILDYRKKVTLNKMK